MANDIDVYIDFTSAIGKERLYEDKVLIAQVLGQLRKIGYVGPDFGHGDLGLQDDKLIVLEAPEEFNAFAANKGWKNLADEFADEEDGADADDSNGQAASSTKLDALKNKFKA